MSFLGVYKALYAYAPQSDQELAIEENDILYLLEKSDVDDWWTVKKRVVGSDVEEPVGLVPSNYIEPADVIASATALFDYDRQTEEEVTFKEGDSFQVFDDKDPDWILVSKNGTEYGFVPSNYIEIRTGNVAPAAAPIGIQPPPSHPSLATSNTTATSEPISSFQPPPQRYDRPQSTSEPEPQLEEEDVPPALPSKTRPESQDYSRHDSSYGASSSNRYDDEYDDAPPPKPTRPSESNSRSDSYSRQGSRSAPQDDEDDQLYTWSVSEVDGRKKKKCMFAIGNGQIYFSPDSVNGGSPQQWMAKDLLSFSSEKKHLFLEFKNPLYSLELHTGTKEVASEILTVLGELKGSVSSSELREVKQAASSKGAKKLAKILYGFEAEGSDELTVREGEQVTIINDTKSKDWWLVQNKNGKSGVVPAQFVDPIQEQSALSSFGSKFKLGRSKSKDNLKESPRKQSVDQSPSKKLSMPKSSRVRTWEDRTGTFKVDAEFLGVVDGKVHLHKTNGVKIGVAANKLSLTDLEYVERVTGMSLESFKGSKKSSRGAAANEERERRERRERERKRREHDILESERRERERDALERERERKERELERREREMDREERDRLYRELDEAKRKLKDLDDIKRKISENPPAKPTRPTSEPQRATSSHSTSGGAKKEDYDWFEFFLEAGVDVNQCQRYSNNFSNEQIDPSILESIDAAVLRTLGLREGDIIRVTRYIDQKFDRKPKDSTATAANGGLFSEQGGALKVNRTGSANQVADSLPAPSAPQTATTDDDAWTVKPAAATSAKANGLQTQQFTGSMQDLVNLKPLEPTKTSSSIKSQPSAKPMEPVKTGPMTAQPTGAPLDPFKTGGGNLLPLATGGFVYLPVQQTGILGVQATGLMPLQKTGGLVPLQKTGGMPTMPTGGLVPLQKTGGLQPMPLQKTGGMPTTTFGMPNTSFGAAPMGVPTTSFGTMPTALTGGMNPALTGGLPAALTGGMPMMPTTSFGANPMMGQRTGGLAPVGTGFNGAPQASFPAATQPTGGLPQGFPQTSFGTNSFPSQATGFQSTQQTGFQPQSQFGINQTGFNSLSSPPTFNTATPSMGFNQQMNNLTNAFQNTGISQPQQTFNTGFQNQPQQSFNTGFQSQPQFNNGFQQQQMPQPSFGGFGQQPQPTFGQQQMPQPTFGQQQAQPLEAQPTGFGFGNSGKADLSKATADNPFGF